MALSSHIINCIGIPYLSKMLDELTDLFFIQLETQVMSRDGGMKALPMTSQVDQELIRSLQ